MPMYEIKEIVYQQIPQHQVILAGDIGGTNSNFGLFHIENNQFDLLISFHTASKKVIDYASLIQDILTLSQQKYGLTVGEISLAAAGLIDHHRMSIKPTNLSVTIDVKLVQQATKVSGILLLNDFEAVALGIDYLDPTSIITINQGKPRSQAQKAFLGAGTGLGKAALLWNNHLKRYLPLASEGGHADCSAQADVEIALLSFIQQELGQNCPVSWEHILSGTGIQRLYRFLGIVRSYPTSNVHQEIAEHGFQPDFISRYARQDQQCHDTFDLYARFYARCAKNITLDMLALNGVYIAGGIAAKNVELFQRQTFMEEFTRCNVHSNFLRHVPVYVITDYNVSLYGAAAFLQLHKQGIV